MSTHFLPLLKQYYSHIHIIFLPNSALLIHYFHSVLYIFLYIRMNDYFRKVNGIRETTCV